ncbi:hypothetical protein [Streptomyces coriariae]|uniref:hypothetical protein n=1 Tax=Streptomyces coriariae TaxID=2864460 RepID=UPI0027E27A61|nr:hypothetical protein [Streptomyces coriariae]
MVSAALRQSAPSRAVELAQALQHAFCVDGHGLSAAATYRQVAEAAGLDADVVAAAFRAPQAQEAAAAYFRRTAGPGVTAFPTPLAVDGSRTVTPARGNATTDEVDHRLAAARTARTS